MNDEVKIGKISRAGEVDVKGAAHVQDVTSGGIAGVGALDIQGGPAANVDTAAVLEIVGDGSTYGDGMAGIDDRVAAIHLESAPDAAEGAAGPGVAVCPEAGLGGAKAVAAYTGAALTPQPAYGYEEEEWSHGNDHLRTVTVPTYSWYLPLKSLPRILNT